MGIVRVYCGAVESQRDNVEMSFLWTMRILSVGLLVTRALSDLTQTPRTTETKIGDKTWLNCSTDLSTPIHWTHGDQHVYAGGYLIEPYSSRFAIEGKYNLIMPSVASTDAGEYKCQDDEGLGTVVSAQLIVLENDPICLTNLNLSQIIGSNDCGIALDRIVLTCEVTYHGNTHPEMVWRKSQGSSVITDGIEVQKSGHKLKYILTMMADDSISNTAFVCETTRSAGKQYTCATEPIRILPACNKYPAVLNVVVNVEVVCFVNFAQSCSYKWFDASNFTISNDATLKPNEVGRYRCEATCFVRNDYYTVVAMMAVVSSNNEGGVSIIIGVAIAAAAAVVIAICVIIFVCRFSRQKRFQRKKRSDPAGLAVSDVLLQDIPISAEEELAESNGHNDETRWTSDPQLIRKFTTNAPGEDMKGISGIAIAGEKLYITHFLTPHVSVYELASPMEKTRFTFEGLVNPWDITYCKTKKCLYVMDLTYINHPKEIIQLDLNGKMLHHWSTQMDYGCISVAFDSNVVLASYEKNRIMEYTSDGILVRRITLSTDDGFEHPRHAVKRSDDSFLVSHGDGDDPLHRICGIDISANVKMVFGGNRGSNFESLNIPIYMAIDSSGSIIVIDRENSRVLLFDSNLKFRRELIPRGMEGMLRPERMAVDESTGRLFIAHNPVNWDNRLFIFKFG